MDILRARKKAAERERARKKKKEPTQSINALPVQEEPPHPAEPEPAPPVTVAESPTPGNEVLAVEGPEAEQAPDSEPLETRTHEIELLSFRLGGEAYALLVQDVREVLKVRDLTPVPNAPSYILGVTSLRGTMMPVIDLCKRLGLTPGERDEKSRFIVVSPDEEDVGLVVDRVTGVFRVLPDAIKPIPENIEQGEEFLRGIVRKDDKLFILLDLKKAVDT